MATVVKICGITRHEDAAAAAAAGAHAIGLVFDPASARCVAPEQARAIVERLPPFVTAVGLFVDADPARIRSVLARVPLNLLQFHGSEPESACTAYGVPYIKAIRMGAGVDLLECCGRYTSARGLLLDAYAAGAPGGTGRSFDWALVPARLPLPVVLAGGLTPANVGDAVRRVRPWAVDVSSGVERAKGIKDAALIAAFVRGVRDADV
jgi:phosphoribosylanthranilate isomerase